MNYVRTPSTVVVSGVSCASPQKQARPGAYVNVQGEEGKRPSTKVVNDRDINVKNHCKIIADSTNVGKINIENNKSNKFNCDKLIPTGTTPKLVRKLLVSDFDTPDLTRKLLNDKENVANLSKFINSDPVCEEPSTELRSERKIKRSESYRMANSPIMFLKKISNNSDKNCKIFRTPSEELQEDLINERINYPETVSSPEPHNPESPDMTEVKMKNPIPATPTSPRPRQLDMEPARVLKYGGNDTEIW